MTSYRAWEDRVDSSKTTVSYCTALYSKQAYCQRERIDAMNAAYREALKHGIEVHSQMLINNSPRSFLKQMVRMHMRYAEFPHSVADYGKINYETSYERKEYDWAVVDSDGNALKNEDSGIEMYSVVHKDVYRLLAHLFNIGIDHAVEKGYDYFGILSGDQIIPPEHPATLVKFLREHPRAGIASALAFFDYSRKEVVCKGKVREYMIPLVIIRERPGETPKQTKARREWIFANLLPNEENGYTGMEFCECDAVGTGGSLIPRKVFTKLKFDERPFRETGQGEDVGYCYEIQDRFGLKVYSVPTVVLKNRYPDGQLY